MADKVELWSGRVAKLEARVTEAEERLEDCYAVSSKLIAEEASEKDVKKAKADASRAKEDLEHVSRALADAAIALDQAKVAHEVGALKAQGELIGELQKKRAAQLEDAEKALVKFLDIVAASDETAVELHTAAGGCRPVGLALNERHGPILTWLVTHLIEVMPIAVQTIGAVAANHIAARAQLEGKTLAGTQPDFLEMFNRHHAEKDLAA